MPFHLGLIPAVLKKLRSSSGVLLTIVAPYWPQKPWFPDLLDLLVQRPFSSTALPSSSSGSVRAVASCLETIQRFARARGVSKYVAQQAALAQRPSSRAGYQAKWSVYRQWCHSEGHSVSHPSLSKITDFLFLAPPFEEIICFRHSWISFHAFCGVPNDFT